MCMNKEKILGYVEVFALVWVLVAACLWLMPQMRAFACGAMSMATVMLAVGRFWQNPFYQKYSPRDPKELTLRRLYHQRVFGIVGLILAAVFMWMPVGFYADVYFGPTSWLIPFVFFVVVEVYTAFRISAVEKG